jgi:hypothetical protein
MAYKLLLDNAEKVRKAMKIAVLLLFVLIVASGCGDTTPPIASTIDTVCSQEFSDKKVVLEGYPYLPSTMLVTDTILIEFYERPNLEGKYIAVSLKVGTGSNQVVEPPDNYTDADLLIRTNDGQEIRAGNRVSVEGKLIYSPTGDANNPVSCILFDGGNIKDVADS